MNVTPAALAALASGNMDNFIAAATPGGIERQEAAGQAALVASATLPKDFNGNTKEQFEKIGIIFGASADDLFVNATLPAGWKKRSTDHSMWSDLIDEQGRKRAGIFYKAAFYDRSAHMSLVARYSLNCYLPCDESGAQTGNVNSAYLLCVVTDGDKTIHTIGHRANRDYETGDAHREQGVAWLNEKFPNWRDATAYWDDSPA